MDINEFLKKKEFLEYVQRQKINKKHLLELINKRIRTSFIGALHNIEEVYPFLKNDKNYQTLRSKILDNGNNQIRGMEKDLMNYEVGQI